MSTTLPLPLGIFSTATNQRRRAGLRAGDEVIDLSACFNHTTVSARLPERKRLREALLPEVLNDYLRLGRSYHQSLCEILEEVGMDLLRESGCLHPLADCDLHLPVAVGDYTDFYASREHATRVGSLFRDPENALPPNWLHLPIGYHGRASSVVVSGTGIVRPKGQFKKHGDAAPRFGPSQRLDYEYELGAVIGKDSTLGQPVPLEEAEDYIFGFVILNDWSARDIQKWEYQPLGPFLGKNFATSISPWIIPLDALKDARVSTPHQDPTPLPYLRQGAFPTNFDIELRTELITKEGKRSTISEGNASTLYWSFAQQLTHHTVNGCNLRAGDLLGSGTISGPTQDTAGCLLELTMGGREPLTLADGSQRTFLEDGDTVILRARAGEVDFGEVRGTIRPANE
ncbi:fumarylacetoacetase [Lewinella sp. W8]|uniref:fumarylacetoacetase n=1 Tax=Lewinella sp. W8 TaxID=2528208 RepID=UPI0010685DA4|nr:fumarylacetoacetase [Lewinella sp. W8]MTB49547.1 fumarylacetoacetase [Lewinella sp. W8]